MPWYFAVIEAKHEIQNPTSPEKIELLGERLGLGPESHVLDVASAKSGPPRVLASRFGCRLTCIEEAGEFHLAARQRAAEAGLDTLIEFVHADARDLPLENERYDAVLCLGATFIWGGLPGTLAALTPAVQPSGFIGVGEPYWRTWPLPEALDSPFDEEYLPLPETMERFQAAGLCPRC
jgi:SAM-dependent methyltransferase